MDDGIEKVLWNEQQIAERVNVLGKEIAENFKPPASAPVIVGVATGAFLFLADIVRIINIPVYVDIIRAESYGFGTESSGNPVISSKLKVDVAGKHVILVEDIVDTGRTLSCLIKYLESEGATSVSVCAFLDKPTRRKVNLEMVGEGKFYRGFECQDHFVVGYGIDFAEKYRNLPYIGVLKPELYLESSPPKN